MANLFAGFERFINLVSEWLNWVSIVGFVALSLLTAIDVILSKVFNEPVVWAYEVTGLLGLIIVYFSVAYTQKIRSHIEIEFFVIRLPETIQKILTAVTAFLGMMLFIFMAWQMFDYAMSLQAAGRVTSIQKIPLSPFAYVSSFCFVAVFLVIVLQFIHAMVEAFKK